MFAPSQSTQLIKWLKLYRPTACELLQGEQMGFKVSFMYLSICSTSRIALFLTLCWSITAWSLWSILPKRETNLLLPLLSSRSLDSATHILPEWILEAVVGLPFFSLPQCTTSLERTSTEFRRFRFPDHHPQSPTTTCLKVSDSSIYHPSCFFTQNLSLASSRINALTHPIVNFPIIDLSDTSLHR